MHLDNFPHFLEYVPTISGGSASWLRKICEEKITEYDTKQSKSKSDDDDDDDDKISKDLKTANKRARKILAQLNSEDPQDSS